MESTAPGPSRGEQVPGEGVLGVWGGSGVLRSQLAPPLQAGAPSRKLSTGAALLLGWTKDRSCEGLAKQRWPVSWRNKALSFEGPTERPLCAGSLAWRRGTAADGTEPERSTRCEPACRAHPRPAHTVGGLGVVWGTPQSTPLRVGGPICVGLFLSVDLCVSASADTTVLITVVI